jgi:hypothetical protein
MDGMLDALAEIKPLVAVAELDCLVPSRRSARRNCGAADLAGCESDLDLDGRVAARVEDLARADAGDLGAQRSSFARSK